MSAIFGETLNFSQENGPDIRLRVFGDEHYARYETMDGYSVIYDNTLGLYCYAQLEGNHFISSGVSLTHPPPSQIVRHLQETSAVKRSKKEQRELLHHTPAGTAFERIVRTFGPNQGLLEGRQLSVGTVRGLTILVNFQDVTSTTTANDVNEMLNGNNFTRNGNICSAREYFLAISSGKLDYTNTVVGPFTLSHPRQFYVNNLLVQEALQLAVASGLNLTQFDSRNEGIIDALNILYAGQSVYQEELWPHNSYIDIRFGNIRTNLYLLTGLGRNPTELSIGTFCHENGHLLCRFPDMYDYGGRDEDNQDSAGIGYYCLMGAGNHLDSGKSPAPVCAYLRDLAGWCDNLIDLNTPGSYNSLHGNYNVVMKYRTSKPNQYFLAENRSRSGFDRAAPASGLAIYHCDVLGSNELQQGTADKHYQCALVQADGRNDLENNNNQGDGADLFGPAAGVVLSSTSRPNTREWDGRESGLIISDIVIEDDKITFNAGGSPASQIATGTQSPNQIIPDNNPQGISSVIAIANSGIGKRIQVDVDISHTYIGDLLIELHAPTGQRAILHAHEGESGDNLKVSYDSDKPGALSTFAGLPMQGNWTLNVFDTEAVDEGTLNSWSIKIESVSAAPQIATGNLSPNQIIPDNNPLGISSIITIANSGIARRIQVDVDISHTYIGDLLVELYSPTGRRAILHAHEGGSSHNLKISYDSDRPGELSTLAGLPMQGNWKLNIYDNAAVDEGILNSWSIKIESGSV